MAFGAKAKTVRILRVEEMRFSDAQTIASGISGAELMYRAGSAVFEAVHWNAPVGILCGSGNNAGDGFVLALLLAEHGIACELFLLSERFSSDGRFYYEKCRAAAIPCALFSEQTELSSFGTLVDCIFGTGFHGSAEGIYAAAIQAMNNSPAYVVSVDIPSGLSGNSGIAEGVCVHADKTVSIGNPQPGNYLNMAKDICPETVCADIGITPRGAPMYLIEADTLRRLLSPRKHDSNKGTYGYVAIIGGSALYSGAVKLSNLSCAALRSGCGVTRLAVPASCRDAVLPYLLESTLVPIPDENGFMTFSPEVFSSLLHHTAACAVGMGWGSGKDNAEILRYLLTGFPSPLLLDADALNTLALMPDRKALLNGAKTKPILTPHPGEFERLSGFSKAEIRHDPCAYVCRFARENNVILLLKGCTTIISDGDTCFLVNRGCPGMATAGSGDLLSGVLVGLLGWLPPTALTVALGAWLCGVAGELAEKEVGSVSMLASDTLRKLPAAFQLINNESEDI